MIKYACLFIVTCALLNGVELMQLDAQLMLLTSAHDMPKTTKKLLNDEQKEFIKLMGQLWEWLKPHGLLESFTKSYEDTQRIYAAAIQKLRAEYTAFAVTLKSANFDLQETLAREMTDSCEQLSGRLYWDSLRQFDSIILALGQLNRFFKQKEYRLLVRNNQLAVALTSQILALIYDNGQSYQLADKAQEGIQKINALKDSIKNLYIAGTDACSELENRNNALSEIAKASIKIRTFFAKYEGVPTELQHIGHNYKNFITASPEIEAYLAWLKKYEILMKHDTAYRNAWGNQFVQDLASGEITQRLKKLEAKFATHGLAEFMQKFSAQGLDSRDISLPYWEKEAQELQK